jgi:hypothetical protein
VDGGSSGKLGGGGKNHPAETVLDLALGFESATVDGLCDALAREGPKSPGLPTELGARGRLRFVPAAERGADCRGEITAGRS